MWSKKYCLGCSPLQQAARLHVLSIFTVSTHQCCFAGQKPEWFSMNCNQFLFSELELDFQQKPDPEFPVFMCGAGTKVHDSENKK